MNREDKRNQKNMEKSVQKEISRSKRRQHEMEEKERKLNERKRKERIRQKQREKSLERQKFLNQQRKSRQEDFDTTGGNSPDSLGSGGVEYHDEDDKKSKNHEDVLKKYEGESQDNGESKGNHLDKLGKKTGLTADEFDDSHEKLTKRLFNRLSFRKNSKRLDSMINKVGNKVSLGFLNGIARKITGNPKTQVNLANVFRIIPQLRIFLVIFLVLFTAIMWIIVLIPLMIAIFGAIIVLLLAGDEVDLSGVDMEGIDTSGIVFEDVASNSEKGGESRKKNKKGGTISNGELGFMFPLQTVDGYIEYNQGWNNRYLEIYGRWKFHLGVDLGCSFVIAAHGGQAELYATDDGVVDMFQTGCPNGNLGACESVYGGNGSYGNLVRIHHPQHDEIRSLYAHMQPKAFVKMGDKVEKGEVIGHCGNSGSSTGHHLHFEVWDGTTYSSSLVDPHHYMGLAHLIGKSHGLRTKIE